MIEADDEAEHVADRFHQPGAARRQRGQNEIEPDVLAAAQEPRRRQQRDHIERVFGDFVGPDEALTANEVAQQDVGR